MFQGLFRVSEGFTGLQGLFGDVCGVLQGVSGDIRGIPGLQGRSRGVLQVWGGFKNTPGTFQGFQERYIFFQAVASVMS